MDINIRKSTKSDLPILLNLIQEFGAYLEKQDKVKITLDDLVNGQDIYRCLLAENEEKEVVGYVLYFYSFHSWTGKSVYIDDIFVKRKFRQKGIGYKLINSVFEDAKAANCKTAKWEVLNWNKDAIAFYIKLGALLDDEHLNCIYNLKG